MKLIRLIAPIAFGLGLTTLFLFGVARGEATDRRPSIAIVETASAGMIRYVAVSGTDVGSCANSTSPCRTPQYAVDQAAAGDEIRVAGGTYTGVSTRSATADYPGPTVITQVLHITKTVTVRGGYSADFAMWSPDTYPTTLDAQSQGRVVFIGGSVSPTIEGLRITGGDASGLGGIPLFSRDGGGGVYVVTATATLDGLEVFSNTAPSSFGRGGGVFLYHSASTLSRSAVQSNIVGFAGGGMDLWQSDGASVIDNTIQGNDANVGGGVHAYQSGFTLIGNTIQDNFAFSGGGGVYLENSDQPDHLPSLTGNLIVSNTATYAFSPGGGVYLFFSDPLMTGNVIRGNRAGYGGGAYFYHSDPTSTNDVIRDNAASQLGPGLYLDGSRAILLHTTLAQNTGADGSGLYVKENSDFVNTVYSTPDLTNAIIVQHTLGITVSAGNTATLNSVLWFGNGSNTTGVGLVQATGAITGDPHFALDGYHLISPSTAIDNGVFAGVFTDIDGMTRPYGAGYDLGADEYWRFEIYLPLITR